MAGRRNRNQRGLKARGVTRCYCHAALGPFKVVQGRSRVARSLDSRNARNKLVPLDLRRGMAIEKKASQERMCCRKREACIITFLHLSSSPSAVQLHFVQWLLQCLPSRSRLSCSSHPSTNTRARRNDDEIEGLFAIRFFVASPRSFFLRFFPEFFLAQLRLVSGHLAALISHVENLPDCFPPKVRIGQNLTF